MIILNPSQESLWLGIGCQRGTSRQVIAAAIAQVCRSHGLLETAIVGVGTIDRKVNEPGLLALCRDRGWPVQFYTTDQLNQVLIPHPATTVSRQIGTASVAEAAALLAAGTTAQLQVSKQVFRQVGQSVTVAIATGAQRG
jgi:cobalt-precorrin 5A hydrolase / precorrin-3B C17-methyltransferase